MAICNSHITVDASTLVGIKSCAGGANSTVVGSRAYRTVIDSYRAQLALGVRVNLVISAGTDLALNRGGLNAAVAVCDYYIAILTFAIVENLRGSADLAHHTSLRA